MTTRSLTDIFVLMRNNASQNRNIYSEQTFNDRLALVPADEDIEFGKIPPSWSSIAEESQFTMVRLKIKLDSLKDLYQNIISRPAFDGNSEDEQQIKILTEEITRMYSALYKSIGIIESERKHAKSPLEQRLLKSVFLALVTDLQKLQTEFKSMESNYINMLKSREERSRPYFDFDTEAGQEEDSWDEIGLVEGSSEQQLLLKRGLEEKEVENILRSFVHLRDIYRDLSRMIVDQGTVLDRIDYNIEMAQSHVTLGTEKLAKAAAYQGGNKKMVCIVILAVTITFLTALLIIVKL